MPIRRTQIARRAALASCVALAALSASAFAKDLPPSPDGAAEAASVFRDLSRQAGAGDDHARPTPAIGRVRPRGADRADQDGGLRLRPRDAEVPRRRAGRRRVAGRAERLPAVVAHTTRRRRKDRLDDHRPSAAPRRHGDRSRDRPGGAASTGSADKIRSKRIARRRRNFRARRGADDRRRARRRRTARCDRRRRCIGAFAGADGDRSKSSAKPDAPTPTPTHIDINADKIVAPTSSSTA